MNDKTICIIYCNLRVNGDRHIIIVFSSSFSPPSECWNSKDKTSKNNNKVRIKRIKNSFYMRNCKKW